MKQKIIEKVTREFFKHIEKKMPQTQALTLALEHNLPDNLQKVNYGSNQKTALGEQTEQIKVKFDKLIELQKLKNQKEESRHKHIIKEIEWLSRAGIKIYVRGDYMNDFDSIKREMMQQTKKAKKSVRVKKCQP